MMQFTVERSSKRHGYRANFSSSVMMGIFADRKQFANQALEKYLAIPFRDG